MTDTAKALIQSIRDLDSEMDKLRKARDVCLQEWAYAVCPTRPGDFVAGDGYTFNGRRCRVTEVRGRLHFHGEPAVQIVARVLKSDGSDSKHLTDWCFK